jgi:hypothetical protein
MIAIRQLGVEVVMYSVLCWNIPAVSSQISCFRTEVHNTPHLTGQLVSQQAPIFFRMHHYRVHNTFHAESCELSGCQRNRSSLDIPGHF